MSVTSAPGAPVYAPPSAGESELGLRTLARVSRRLSPFILLLYLVAYIDRTNVGIAALQMNRDLKFSASVYGLGAGVFYLGYSVLEVPSNLILARVGARRWIGRIMITWGIIATAMMFVRTPGQFYGLRVALGVAEAGFAPGIYYYLSEWFPSAQRGRAIARFVIGIPLSEVIGGPLGGWILGLNGRLGLRGWQWLFLLEGMPAIILGFVTLVYLTDTIEDARWLSNAERQWLTEHLGRERDAQGSTRIHHPLSALSSPMVWLLVLVWFLMATAGLSYSFWAPQIIRGTLHTSNAATGWIVGGFGALSVIAMTSAASSSDRRGERFLHAATGLVVSSAGFVGAALLPAPWGPVASFALLIIGLRAAYPIFWCLPTTLLRGTAAAAGIGLVNGLGQLGGVFGPSVFGLLKDLTGGTTVAFLLLATLPLSAGGLLLVLRRQSAFAVGRR